MAVAEREYMQRTQAHGLEARGTEGEARGAEGHAREAQFAPHQLAWLADAAPIRCWRKSRRIGADYLLAYEAVADRATGKRTVDLNYISTDHDKTRIWIKYCVDFLKMFGVFVEAVAGVEMFDDKAVRIYELQVPCGGGRRCTIRALTSNPAAARGFDGDVILAEFAHHPQQRQLWEAASKCALLGGRISVQSTVGVEGDVQHLIEQMGERRAAGAARPGDMPVSLHVATIEDVAHNGYLQIINRSRGTDFTPASFLAEARAACLSEEEWQAECMCVRSRDEGSYFPRGLLGPCSSGAALPIINVDGRNSCGVFDLPPGQLQQLAHEEAIDAAGRLLAGLDDSGLADTAGILYAGCDIGRKSDRFVIALRGWIDGKLRSLGYIVCKDVRFAALQEIGRLVMQYRSQGRRARVARMNVDATGMGMPIAERWGDEFRGGRIGQINFTAAVKAQLATGGRALLEDGRIELPADRQIINSWAKVRKQVTAAGNISYRADEDADGHADECWADLLCIEAATEQRPTARAVPLRGGVCA